MKWAGEKATQGVRRRGFACGALVGAGLLSLGIVPAAAQAQARQVAYGGVSFAGTAQSIEERFPYSRKYAKALLAADDSLYKKAAAAVRLLPSRGFELTIGTQIADLKGRDEAVVACLVLSSETVSIERFGNVRKLFVLLRGQALFFDYKSSRVLRAYPVSFGYVDNFVGRDPSDDEVLDRVRMVFEGAGNKPGLFTRFATTLSAADLPNQATKYLGVKTVTVAPEMLTAMPPSLKSSPAVYETWAADLVSEAISTRVGVPVVPFMKGEALGNTMAIWISDSEVYNLQLPSLDYEIAVAFKNVRKVKFGESTGGASWVYGTYADIRIDGPLGTYLNTALKNGETKIVPASQTQVDDFPAYYDSLNGLFVKLSETVAGKGGDWIKSAAAAPDVLAQIAKTKELMNQCK